MFCENVLPQTLQRQRELPIAVLPNEAYALICADGHLIGVVGTGLVATAHCIGRQQIGCHALDFFRDAEVAFQGKSTPQDVQMQEEIPLLRESRI